MAETLAPATVRTHYGVLKAVMNAAVEADLLVRSPCRGIRLPNTEKRARAALEAEDLERLASGMRPEYRPVVYVAGVLGLRWSEVAGLRVRHLDFLRRTLTVSETITEVNGKLLPASTKSAAGRRTLAVPPFLMATLAEHLAARGRPGPDELIFIAPAGGRCGRRTSGSGSGARLSTLPLWTASPSTACAMRPLPSWLGAASIPE